MAMLAKLTGCTLGAQVRFASKIVTGNMKNKVIFGGRGGPLARKHGWKIMPGGIAPQGFTIYHEKICGTQMGETEEDPPFSMYPGLNTVRDDAGYIRATVDGIVRVAKQPGTEGTADRVFLWVDPHIKDYMTRECERHRHRANGNEFAVDEVEQRFLGRPRWTHKAGVDREQVLPDWPYNPEWDKDPDKRNYDKQVNRRTMNVAQTERQKYESADYEMFYSRMPNRKRSYSFGGHNYEYKGSRLEEDPFGENYGVRKYMRKVFAEPADNNPITARRHDRKQIHAETYSTYKVSDQFGHFFEDVRGGQGSSHGTMLRRSLARLYPFMDGAPDPVRIASNTAANRPLGWRTRPEPGTFAFTRDELAHQSPAYGKTGREFNRHTMQHLDKAAPLQQKVRCPWCHEPFDFTYEEYRRDPALQARYKAHEDSHTPPPGWEPDPRPMKGKGVTQYDARHRFGWMLGEEW